MFPTNATAELILTNDYPIYQKCIDNDVQVGSGKNNHHKWDVSSIVEETRVSGFNRRRNNIVDILLKENEKYPDRFEFVNNPEHLSNLRSIVEWISESINFEKIGIDATPWGSIIFSILIDSQHRLHLTYDYTVEDKDDELYFSFYENNSEKATSINSTNKLLSNLTDYFQIDGNFYPTFSKSPETAAFQTLLQIN